MRSFATKLARSEWRYERRRSSCGADPRRPSRARPTPCRDTGCARARTRTTRTRRARSTLRCTMNSMPRAKPSSRFSNGSGRSAHDAAGHDPRFAAGRAAACRAPRDRRASSTRGRSGRCAARRRGRTGPRAPAASLAPPDTPSTLSKSGNCWYTPGAGANLAAPRVARHSAWSQGDVVDCVRQAPAISADARGDREARKRRPARRGIPARRSPWPV